MKTQMYALVTNQGTATHETALCAEHFTEENKQNTDIPDDAQLSEGWHDCTGNEALACNVCGVRTDEDGNIFRMKRTNRPVGATPGAFPCGSVSDDSPSGS